MPRVLVRDGKPDKQALRREAITVDEISSVARERGFDGHVSAVDDGRAWAIEYSIELRPDWTTRS